MDSYSIQENVKSLKLIPQQQPGVEEEQLDMQIMPIEDHVDASATLERLSNFKASQPDSVVVSEDVVGILLCDNVSDGSPSIDTNLNEIVQKEEVVGDIAVGTGSGDQSLKYDCLVNSNQVCNYQNNVALFQEVVVGDTTVPIGSGENLEDSYPVNSNEVRNYQNNGGDQSLKDGCDVNSNKVCNYQNNGGDENLKDGCHVNSNEVCNYHNDGGSFHEVQTESNLFAIMVSKQVSPAQSFENLIHEGDDIMNVDCDDECENQGNNAFVEDVDKSSLNQSVLTVLIDHIRLLSNQVTALVNEQANLKDMVNKLITSRVPSTKALVAEVVKFSKDVRHLISKQKELSDEVQQLRDSSLSKTSTEDTSKAVFALIKLELKTFIQSITDLFSKTNFNIHVPEDFTMRHVQLSPEFASLPAKIQEFCSKMNDIVNFKVEISNLANKNQENVSTFKEFCDYFSNLQNSVNVFENHVEESIPTKKEKEEDQQLLDVISLDQGIIKRKISKIAECMLLLMKWAKMAKIYTTYAQKERKQHIVAESSNKNDEICDNVTANPTSSDGRLSHKPDDIFRYEAGGVEHVMTSKEIAKQKEDEEIIKRKNEENKASYREKVQLSLWYSEEVPPSPDYIPGPKVPPSPDYVLGPEEPEQAPPSPVYIPFVLDAVYLEFILEDDEIFPAKEQPMPAAASPTDLSPGYIPESDPEEDPEEDDEDPEEDLADYPANRDDDDEEEDEDPSGDDVGDDAEDEDEEEEEEHLAPADPVLPILRVTAKISIRDEPPSISITPRIL
ncbi:hypothetical protein Tco_0623213, partial [Tanacetum coccineum]